MNFHVLASLHLSPALVVGIAVAALLILVDWVLGIAIAVRAHKFQWSLLPRQMETVFLKAIGSLSLATALQSLLSGNVAVAVASFVGLATATVYVRSLADIRAKLVVLFGKQVADTVVQTVQKDLPKA